MELWEQEDDEPDIAYAWFQRFLSFDDFSINHFYNSLLYETDKPKKKTMYNWSSLYNWRSRKKAYVTRKQTEQRNRLIETNFKKKEELFKAKHNLIIKAINKCSEDFDNAKMTGTQFSNWVSGINGLLNDNRLDVNEPTEITDATIDAFVDADVNADLSIFEKIQKIDEELDKI